MAKYSATQKEYIKSVDGYAHQSAVEIIGRIEQQCDELAEALGNLVKLCEALEFDSATTGRQILMRDARAALAKYRKPQEAPELFPGTLEKLRDLGK